MDHQCTQQDQFRIPVRNRVYKCTPFGHLASERAIAPSMASKGAVTSTINPPIVKCPKPTKTAPVIFPARLEIVMILGWIPRRLKKPAMASRTFFNLMRTQSVNVSGFWRLSHPIDWIQSTMVLMAILPHKLSECFQFSGDCSSVLSSVVSIKTSLSLPPTCAGPTMPISSSSSINRAALG